MKQTFDKLMNPAEAKKVFSWGEMLNETLKQTRRMIDVLESELEKTEDSMEKITGEPLGDKVKKRKKIMEVVNILKNNLENIEAAIKTLEESETRN